MEAGLHQRQHEALVKRIDRFALNLGQTYHLGNFDLEK